MAVYIFCAASSRKAALDRSKILIGAKSVEIILNILVLVLGLIIGSFLSVCIYRVPLSRLDRWYSPDEGEEAQAILAKLRKDMSISTPARSFCPVCQHQLRWYENIPVFSWFFLRGKCASCQSPIAIRYPVLELLCAVFALLSVLRFGLTPTALLIFIVICVFIVVTFIDFDYYVIPDEISVRGSIIAVSIAVINHFWVIFSPPVVSDVINSIIGMLCGAGFLLFVYYAYYLIRRKEGLGLGDIKLLLFIGALFGPEGVIYTIFMGSLFGSVIGLLLILFCGRKLSSAIPFGPYLTIAATLYLYTGYDLAYKLIGLFSGAAH